MHLFELKINFNKFLNERNIIYMNVYFDTEFTGLHKDTTLISIGLVTENGDTFYAEFNDYDKTQCNDWIQENVINNLYGEERIKELRKTEYNAYVYGNKNEITEELKLWLDLFKGEEIQFVSDVCHYDFVLLIDLFGSAFDLPKNINPACYDVNQDIARFLDISNKEAFDKSREDFLWDYGINIPGEKHNSLYDALVIKEIYQFIN